MKSILTLILCLQAISSVFATNMENVQKDIGIIETIEINELDTVLFSLDLAVIETTTDGYFLQIPVFILSDDVINSLDFSMKLDINNVEYVDVIDHTNHIQYASFYNPIDTTLRFTSNSFENYPKGANKIVSIKLKLLNGNFDKSYISDEKAFLNGDVCSTKLSGEIIIVKTEENPFWKNKISVFPNPASETIIISSPADLSVEFLNTTSNQILKTENIYKNLNNQIDISELNSGVYFVLFKKNNQIIFSHRILILNNK